MKSGVLAVAALLGLLSGCADRISLVVLNETAAPMRCRIMFAHWVEVGSEPIPPDGAFSVFFQRRVEDGALYIVREDGRQMMIENVLCGPSENWWKGRADIPLVPIRSEPERYFITFCRRDDAGFECLGPTGSNSSAH